MGIDVGDIKKPAKEPATAEDKFTQQERLKFTPTEQVRYEHEQLVNRLDQQIVDHRNKENDREKKLDRLHEVEIAFGALKYAHTVSRWIYAFTATAMAIGGALISTYSESGTALFGIGWGLVLVGAGTQIMAFLINPKSPK